MTKSLLLLSVTALLLPACQAGTKPANATAEVNSTGPVDTGADEQAIRGQVDTWLKLVKAKDAAAIAALYTEDGAVMPPNGPIGKGHTAIQQTCAPIHKALKRWQITNGRNGSIADVRGRGSRRPRLSKGRAPRVLRTSPL